MLRTNHMYVTKKNHKPKERGEKEGSCTYIYVYVRTYAC